MKTRLIYILSAVTLSLLATGPLIGQAQPYTVGQRVEYKDKSWPAEVWKEGTIVKVLPEFHQVVVRWDPRDDYPSYTHNGVSIYEQAYNTDSVRPIKPKTNNQPVTNNAGPPARPATNPTEAQPEPAVPAAGNGTGLMTKQEIIDYMKTHGYVNGQTKHDVQVCKDLIEIMKKRGVREALDAGKDYDGLQLINANGCAGHWSTDVAGASVRNQGIPPTINWLAATWTLTKFGDTVYSAPGDGYIYKQGPKMGTQGSLSISTNGSYTWNDGNGHLLKGTWRNATSDEMKTQGGTGIVLLQAADGRDWLVYKYQSRVPNKTERIEVEDLEFTGQSRWIGWRK